MRVFTDQFERCRVVLIEKGKGVGEDEDRLRNFKMAAILQDIRLGEALAGMMAQHTIFLYDMIHSGKAFTVGEWDEKITDNINYLILLRALIEEKAMRDESSDKARQIIVNVTEKEPAYLVANPDRVKVPDNGPDRIRFHQDVLAEEVDSAKLLHDLAKENNGDQE